MDLTTQSNYLPTDVASPSRLVWGIAAGAFLLALGTALGAILNTPTLGIRTPMEGPSLGRSLLRSIGVGPLDWLACAMSSPLFYWLARRYPINRQRWPLSVPLHLGLATVLVIGVALAYYGWVMPAPPSDRSILRYFIIGHLFTGGPAFGVMIAAIHALEFYRRLRQREVEAARLQAQLVASRLEALTAQLHPHFLFNTLQGISTLIHRDPAAADVMLAGLSDLLRLMLQHRHDAEVPLNTELEGLALYVGLCQERFKDRLVFESHIEEETLAALVPFFILQPLVENAMQHGIARRSGTGHVGVRAELQGAQLLLQVYDDGPGLDDPEHPLPEQGIGLSNVRNRLLQLYGERQEVSLRTPTQGGLCVTLLLPFKAPSAAAAAP